MGNTSHPITALVGQLIDKRYHILRELGSEELSWVYLASDRQQHDKHVKFKVLQPQLMDRAPQRARFLKEARIQESLWHPSVVQIHAIQETDDHAYIAMEWIEGETLGELAKRFGSPLSIDAVIKLVQPIGKTLAYAHNTQVSHHKLNPDTVVIDWSGEFLEVKVTDFSLPLAPGTRQHSDAMTASAHKSVAYISPEQAADTGQVDHRTDVYSLGACMYLLAAGRPPFVGVYQQVAQELLSGGLKRITEVAPTCPPVLGDVIHKCMAASPDDRYQSVQEVLDELTKLRPFAANQEHIEIIGLNPPSRAGGYNPMSRSSLPAMGGSMSSLPAMGSRSSLPALGGSPTPQRQGPAIRRSPAPAQRPAAARRPKGGPPQQAKWVLPLGLLLLLGLGGGLWFFLGRSSGACKEGATRACYTGPAATKGKGRCRAGQQTCTKGVFGACEEQVLPAAKEVCNGKDDDCDGKIDNAPDFADLGKACEAREGACLTPGRFVCAASGESVRCKASRKPKGKASQQLNLLLLPESQPITVYWRSKAHKAKGFFCLPKPKRRRSTVLLKSKGYHTCRLRLKRKRWQQGSLTLELKRKGRWSTPPRRAYCLR